MDVKLNSFLNADGQLTSFPAKRRMKLHALLYLAGKFEPGRDYSEKEVNDILNKWHTFSDPATLRRELYNKMFFYREATGSIYRLEARQPTIEELESKYL